MISLSVDQSSNSRSVTRGQVKLEITDSGIGMSQKFLDDGLWTPFKQASAQSSGTGLGLSIVKQIAADLNGNIDVRSRLGEGTQVTLTFQTELEESDSNEIPDLVLEPKQLKPSSGGSQAPQFHLLVPQSQRPYENADVALATARGVKQIADGWLHCITTEGDFQGTLPKDAICAISELDLAFLAEKEPSSLKILKNNLATLRLPLLVLGCTLDATTPVRFEDTAVELILMEQP